MSWTTRAVKRIGGKCVVVQDTGHAKCVGQGNTGESIILPQGAGPAHLPFFKAERKEGLTPILAAVLRSFPRGTLACRNLLEGLARRVWVGFGVIPVKKAGGLQ